MFKIYLIAIIFIILWPTYICLQRYHLERSKPDSETPHTKRKMNLKDNNFPSISLLNLLNVQYNIIIGIGSSHQVFSLMLDTSSPLIWILSNSTYNEHPFTTNQFQCNKSLTCNDSEKVINFCYANDLCIKGKPFKDTLHFTDNIKIDEYSMFMATEAMNFEFLNGFADGIFGIGLGSSIFPSVIDTMKKKNLIKEKSFSIFLSTTNLIADVQSELIFGGYDSKYMISPFQFFPLSGTLHYVLSIESWTCGNIIAKTNISKAFLETGTMTIVAPIQEFSYILAVTQFFNPTCAIKPDSFEIMCNCTQQSDILNFPDFNFNFTDIRNNSVGLKIQSKRYVTFKEGACKILIQSSSNNNETWIFGEIFLQEYYVYINLESMKIGLAQANPNPGI